MFKNAILTLTQAIVSLVTLFYSYSLITKQLGVDLLGAWALFVSIFALTRFAEFGMSGTVLKFISANLAKNDHIKARANLDTAMISCGVLVGLCLLAMYYPFKFIYHQIVGDSGEQYLDSSLPILASIYVWLQAVSGVSKLSLDSCQRYDLSTFTIIISSLVFLLTIKPFVDEFGIVGLAMSNIAHALCILVLSRIALKHVLIHTHFLPRYFSKESWNDMRSYGVKFEIIFMVKIFLEPLTKGLLGKFGGLESLGYFEMANKTVIQVRSLLVSMNQVIIPRVSFDQVNGKLDIRQMYENNFKIILFVTTYFFIAVLSLLPILQNYWFEQRIFMFEIFSAIALVSLFVNTLSIPAYMINLGLGRLNSNVISHALMGIVNIILGVLLGLWFSEFGVVVAWGLALVAGALPIIITFHRYHSIHLTSLFCKQDIYAICLGLVAAAISWIVFFKTNDTLGIYGSLCISFGFSFCLLIIPFWTNPIRILLFKRCHLFLINFR